LKYRRERINNLISAPTVRLIGPDGNMVGIKPTYEALNMARNAGMDLVEIVPQANPPVCKIVNYSKFKYEKEKRERENRKKQKSASFKEIKIHPRIASHDLQTKINRIKDFLSGKHKVRVSVVFHGRENDHRELGYEILERVKAEMKDAGRLDGKINAAGNTLNILLNPKQ